MAKTQALPKPVIFHKNLKHKLLLVPLTSGPHYGFYKCLTCNTWLAWANKHTDTDSIMGVKTRPARIL